VRYKIAVVKQKLTYFGENLILGQKPYMLRLN